MEILIRALEPSNYDAVYDLISNELGYDNLNAEKTLKRIETIRNHRDYKTFVAVYSDKVIGFIGLFKGIAFNIDGVYMQVIALAVNKDYQNKGVGTRLLENYARSENIDSLGLNSGLQRGTAHIFYELRGYVKKSYCFTKSL